MTPRAVALALLAAITVGVRAQEDRAALEARWLLAEPGLPSRWTNSPAASLGSPLAFGLAWGDVMAAAAYQDPNRGRRKGDGAYAVGAGVGDPATLAAEAVLTGLSTFRSGWFTRTAASVKMHRRVGAGLSAAVGVEQAAVFGSGRRIADGGRSTYGALSWARGPMVATAGLGDGRFRDPGDVSPIRRSPGVFGAVALRISPRAQVIADWPGHDLNVGASFVPWRDGPLVVTLAAADLTRRANTRPRLLVGVGALVGLRP